MFFYIILYNKTVKLLSATGLVIVPATPISEKLNFNMAKISLE